MVIGQRACRTRRGTPRRVRRTKSVVMVHEAAGAVLDVWLRQARAGVGRRMRRGGRHYFDCAPMILALVDVGAGGMEATPIPDNIYFAVSNLERAFERARAPGCVLKDDT